MVPKELHIVAEAYKLFEKHGTHNVAVERGKPVKLPSRVISSGLEDANENWFKEEHLEKA
jgi:hypothetical protein